MLHWSNGKVRFFVCDGAAAPGPGPWRRGKGLGYLFPVRASAQGSLLVLQTFGLTTSNILKGLGGFPELQIPRFQKHESQLSSLAGFRGDPSTFYAAMLFQKVYLIIRKSDQVQC